MSTTNSLLDNGSIFVAGGSTLTANGFTMGGNGSLTLDGTLASTGGIIDFSNGNVTINNGTVIGTINGSVENAGGLTLDGGVTGDLTNDDGAGLALQGSVGGQLYNDGYLSLGDPAAVTAGSFYQDSDGTLIMELDGYLQGTQYDFLNIIGAAHLDGDLDVVFGSGVDLNQAGAIFDLIDWGSWDGSQFADMQLPTLDAGLAWMETYGANGFSLEIESSNPSPEPATWWGLGLLTLVAGARRSMLRTQECAHRRDSSRRSRIA